MRQRVRRSAHTSATALVRPSAVGSRGTFRRWFGETGWHEFANRNDPGNQDRDFDECARLTRSGKLDHAIRQGALVAVGPHRSLFLRTTGHAVCHLHRILIGRGRRHARTRRRNSRHQGRSGSNHDPHRNPQRQKPAHDSPKFHGRKIPEAGRIDKPRYRDFGPHQCAVTSRPREDQADLSDPQLTMTELGAIVRPRLPENLDG
jgi:hypothetical protein